MILLLFLNEKVDYYRYFLFFLQVYNTIVARFFVYSIRVENLEIENKDF